MIGVMNELRAANVVKCAKGLPKVHPLAKVHGDGNTSGDVHLEKLTNVPWAVAHDSDGVGVKGHVEFHPACEHIDGDLDERRAVDVALRNACEFCAKWGDGRSDDWADVRPELSKDGVGVSTDGDAGEFDDLVGIVRLVLLACGLEVDDEVHGCEGHVCVCVLIEL